VFALTTHMTFIGFATALYAMPKVDGVSFISWPLLGSHQGYDLMTWSSATLSYLSIVADPQLQKKYSALLFWQYRPSIFIYQVGAQTCFTT